MMVLAALKGDQNMQALSWNQPSGIGWGLQVALTCLLFFAGCSRTPTTIAPSPDPPVPRSATTDSSRIVFKQIPTGTVRLGSVSSEPGRDATMERFITAKVNIFEISETEINYSQWYSIMKPKHTVSSSLAVMPITNITWYEATQFCELLTIKSGIRHRLPTEAEWEYACRAGSTEMISVWNGNCPLTEAVTAYIQGDHGKLERGIKASCNIDSDKILPVGRFPANRFGLRDMHGNCWEWISVDKTLTEPPSPMHAPIRGGSAVSPNVLECRTAKRSWQQMKEAKHSIGVRIVREIAP